MELMGYKKIIPCAINQIYCNEQMGNALRYSMFTNMFVRLADAVTGSF